VDRARNSSAIIQNKLRKVKDTLKGWGANVKGDSLKLKKELLCELENSEVMEEDNVVSGAKYARKGDIQASLMKLYEKEELYWFSRSSEKCLLEGDNNIVYFHRVANGRKGKNTMFRAPLLYWNMLQTITNIFLG
jgi:hypothetical protein